MISSAPRPGKLLASRDFVNFRWVDSPVAGIAQRFYSFLGSDHSSAVEARYAYATAFMGQEPAGGMSDYLMDNQLDAAVKNMFQSPPKVVLAQGTMKPYGLFARVDSDGNSIHSAGKSITTTASNSPVDPYDSVFVPWTIHQILKDAIEAGDDEETRCFAAYFAFACIVHETAHWVAVSRHGYVHDRHRDIEHANKLAADPSRASITIHSRNDWGTHAKELLLGNAFQYLTYADGTSEVVTQRILPLNPHLKPCLPSAVQAHVIDCQIPTMVDITRFGRPNVRDLPKWKDSGFLIVTSVSPDVACHHGACRSRLTKH
ncbi:hypothetical protein BT69DRAFT_1322562 [Atractiella rhizophila]|nr:hypothetical protein BT69DRAFT_1353600 [Atractiella rhizophila]KAH8918853.1 hypothetical protein BT69DRAFT_1322562 [Atractiella rhizophila]